MTGLERVGNIRSTLGEGPTWDATKNTLYWVDILEHKVHMFDFANNHSRTIDVGQLVGAVVPKEDGDAVLALKHGFYTLNLDTEEISPIVEAEIDLPDNRFNDGKCDALGRFWAGTMHIPEEVPSGTLYCLDVDHTLRRTDQQVTVSNGLGWSPDNKTMYYIDSPTKQVMAFDYDLAEGVLTNRRVAFVVPPNKGVPDGMTVDSQGMIWVAHWGGGQVSRWNPVTGELLEEIPVPAVRVTSCVFGGEDLQDLYITTARVGLSDEFLSEQPDAGGLFRLRTHVTGLPTHPYRG